MPSNHSSDPWAARCVLSTIGRRRALLLSGLLHGIWHLPILLLTPYYHSTGNPLIVVPLFLATLTLTGVVYGELRMMTGSVWPAALAHGAGNSFWSTFTGLTVATSPLALEYLAGESGILPLIGLVFVAGWVLYRLGQEPRAVLGHRGERHEGKERQHDAGQQDRERRLLGLRGRAPVSAR